MHIKNLNIFDINSRSVEPILNWQPKNNSVIYNNRNEVIAEKYSHFQIYTPYEHIPQHFIDAIISTEDRNFFSHQGFDLWGILRASYQNFMSDKKQYVQGASTITQQVVRHFLLSKEKTITRKIKEIFLAIELEKHLEKERILEIYSNVFYLGNGTKGIAACAKRIFNKSLDQLKLHELALIAGLYQSPSSYNPLKNPELAKNRQTHVLRSMLMNRFLNKDELTHWTNQALIYSEYHSTYGLKSPYFIDYVISQTKKRLGLNSIKNLGLKIYTTLDPEIQDISEHSIKKTITQNNRQRHRYENLEVAMLVTEHKTGHIVAMIGGKNYQKSQYNRAYSAKRQPGSVFKPVVYSYALAHGAKWNDLIYISPLNLPGNYKPRSAESDYMKPSTLLRSFYRSINSATIELGTQYGLENIIQHAKKLGIKSDIKNEYGSILGSSELTLFDLARMYSVFANQGNLSEMIGINKILDMNDHILYKAPTIAERTSKILSKEVAFLMNEGMRNVLTHGTGKAFKHLSYYATGKTGTSNKSKDNWFAGSSDYYTAITWVGNDQSKEIEGDAQGSTLALPIWADFMNAVSKYWQSYPDHIPKGLVALKIDPFSGKPSKHGIPMWFRKENAPQHASAEKSHNVQNFRAPYIR